MITNLTILEKEPKSIYTIRFQDCDPMGHLNNSRYLDYVLNAREDHLEKHYDMRLRDFISKGMGWVVASHDIYYLKPALYNEKINIQTSLIHYSENDLIIEGIITNAQETHYKSLLWTRYVFVNVRTGKKENHTEELVSFFNQVKNDKVNAGDGSKSRMQQLLAREKTYNYYSQ